jgi:hypothetical protein
VPSLTPVRDALRVFLIAGVVVGAIVAALALGYILAASPHHSLAHVHCPGNAARIGRTNLCR